MAIAVPDMISAKKPLPVWQVTRLTDPVTGYTSCVVAALDRVVGTTFTRIGILYPIVENNSVHGLLVGVSSGGRFRLPTGDILWRVDDRPYRELKAADNPVPASGAGPPATAGDDPAAHAMRDAMATATRMSVAMTGTSTVASGPLARDMLAEMLGGKGLIFRAAATSVDYGLPSAAISRVGQITRDGLRPYPIDDSFRSGLKECGIDVSR